jgi:hypothetical protein
MNSYVKLKGYVEGKVPYVPARIKFGREIGDLCEDHRTPFANMDHLKEKWSTFKWFEWTFIINKVELISIPPLFPHQNYRTD